MSSHRLLAGADVRAITPAVGSGAPPVFLAGFGGDRRATAVDHDLCVRTLAIASDGGRPFVLAVCDLIGVLRADAIQIRDEVADLVADVVVAATHTHSGPDTIGLWGPDPATPGVDRPWLARMRSTVAASIRTAVASMEPAVIRFASTSVDGVIANFRDPEVVDAQVGALAVDAADGRAIATLANIGCHPEVLGPDSTLISPDLAGACARALERGRGGVGLWVSGDLGGMQSPVEGPRTVDEAEHAGTRCADAALAALDLAPAEHAPTARVRSASVRLPLWNPAYRGLLAAGVLEAPLAVDGTIETEVGFVRLGRSRWACWPGEVLPRLGMESKRRLDSPFPFLIGLANDELGYILPAEDFVEPTNWADPGERYEESMSVGPMTGPMLLAALDELVAADRAMGEGPLR